MPKTFESPGLRIKSAWQLLKPWPGGCRLFSRLLGLIVPYTASIGAQVIRLEPGRVTIEMRDRRRIRNHLNSIHAVALANLGEASSGLALLTALPENMRGIVTKLSTEYFKKARGTLVAEGRCSTCFPLNENSEHIVKVNILDQSGETVATTTAHWRLGPI